MSATISSIVLLAVVIGLSALMLRPSHSQSRSDELLFSTTAPSTHKQLWTCGMHPQVIQDHPGLCPICHMKLVPLKSDAGTATGAKKVAYWWDPMLGPSSISSHPGKSAMGMDLVPVYEDQVQAGPGVRIDPTVVQNMGVLTAPVTRGTLNVTVRAVGMLEVPEPAITDVTLRVSGYIEKLEADTEGMSVAKGQVLFDLYSPDVQVAEQELIGAERAIRALGDPSISAQSDVRRLVQSARRKLQLWGIADTDIDAIAAADQPAATVPFRSPAGGDIAEKAVVEGSAVQAGQRLMRIENHSKLWLDAEVYEDQIEAVAVGQSVRATVDGLPGKTFAGTVSFIYPHVNHLTRTEVVRTELDNPQHELRPGMYATVEIDTQPATNAITVPREAVIDTGTRQIVFVADPMQPGHFEPRNVRRGLSGDDDRMQIVEGLAPGEQVVTSGEFLMDVESQTTEAIQKLRGTESAALSSPARSASMSSAASPTTMAMPASMSMGGLASPATAPSATLTVAHCPMKKADWLQIGDTIVNPFFGTAMPTCGSVVRQVSVPPAGSPLAAVVNAYLKVAGGLDSDRLDTAAIQSLKHSADAVPGDTATALRKATDALSAARNIESARAAFAAEGAALIPLLSTSR